jgi:cytochrome c-type biogenesis protein CcmE
MVSSLATPPTLLSQPKKIMNHLHKRRLYYIGLLAIGLSLSAGLILYALKQNINVFLTPSQLQTTHLYSTDHLRLGGMVKMHSVVRDTHNLNMQFIVTDYKQDILVRYNGVLPDLFREGKGVIVEGNLDPQGIFIAYLVLAKHDENYMPKNVYKALRGQTT